MKSIIKKIFNGYKIYSVEEENFSLLLKVLNNDFLVKKEFKNSSRNYVAEIVIDDRSYILKDNRNEYSKLINILKKLFSDSEGLLILKNMIKTEEEGFNNFAKILVVIEKRKFGILKKSLFIMENIEGEVCKEDSQKNRAIELTKKLHSIGRYHGDCNPYNFMEEKNGSIKMIDTKLRKMFFGNYRAHYDMLTMKLDSYKNMIYPYEKNIFYYVALGIKKLKRL